MPVALAAGPAASRPVEAPKLKRWTREELRAFVAAGFHELERYELFDGKLYDKMGKNRPHVYGVYALTEWLRGLFPGRVLQESPIDLRPQDNATYRPEPDVVVLKQNVRVYKERDPEPGDLELVVEVADSSLEFDREEKAPKYAQAGIVEYWVLDVNNRRMIVHRDPGPEGYRTVLAYAAEEAVAPLAAPEHGTTAAALLQ